MTISATLDALLSQGVLRLRTAAAEGAPAANPGLDAQVLLAHALGIPRARLLSHPEAPGDPARTRIYLALLERRAAGEPLAYLTGRREFWSLELAVGPAVLVPRPETELLVERALALRPDSRARVADLGTGSGAVALALASERAHWEVVATDLSAQALAIARMNATALGLARVDFRLGDWFAALGREERFDLLVSNPPYVAAEDPLMSTLQHEPLLALTPGSDALACLRTLARGAPQYLNPGGWLLLEHGASQGAQVRDELVLAGFSHVRSHRDLAAHERMTEGKR